MQPQNQDQGQRGIFAKLLQLLQRTLPGGAARRGAGAMQPQQQPQMRSDMPIMPGTMPTPQMPLRPTEQTQQRQRIYDELGHGAERNDTRGLLQSLRGRL